VLSNAVAAIGYMASAVASGFYVSFSPTTLLAGAAFSRLVLGLALQPTLGSFFAGLLTLLSGAGETPKPNPDPKLAHPVPMAFTPGYEYFSPDSVYAGYMGEVKEVGCSSRR